MASSLQVNPRAFVSDSAAAAVQKVLELGLSLLGASNKSELHNIIRPEALVAREASGCADSTRGGQQETDVAQATIQTRALLARAARRRNERTWRGGHHPTWSG